MSGYQAGLLVILCFNIIAAYAVYLPLAAGQLNLGTAGFMAAGAYTAAYLSNELGWSPAGAISIGGLAAGGLALVVAIPILSTDGIYLALATFALGQVVSAVFLNLEVVGAAAGYQVAAYVPTLSVVAVTIGIFLFVTVLAQTRFALYLTAIRNDRLVSDLLGLNVDALQVAAFTLGAILAGIGGGLYGHHFSFLEAQHFNAELSIYAVLYVLLGGTQTVWGPLAGAAIFTLAPELLRTSGQWRYVLFAAFIICFMAFRPQGMLTPDLARRLTHLIGRVTGVRQVRP